MFSKIPLSYLLKSGLVMLLILTLLGSIGWFTKRSIEKENEINQEENYSRLIIEQANDLLVILIEAEVEQQGYLISAEKDYLQRYRSRVNKVQQRLTKLLAIVQDEPEYQSTFSELIRLLSEKLSRQNKAIKLRQSEGFEAQQILAEAKNGKALITKIQVLIKEIVDTEKAQLHQRSIKKYQSNQNIVYTVFIFDLVTGVLLIALMARLMQEISWRLKYEDELIFQRSHLNELVKQRTIELQAEKNTLDEALKAANAGLWEWNAVLNQTKWSQHIWNLFGLEADASEATYDLWLSKIHPEDRAHIEKSIAVAATQKTEIHVEWRLIKPTDNTVHWFLSRGKPITEATQQHLYYRGIVIDITQRKIVEEALKESQTRMRLANEVTGVGIWEWNILTNKILWDPQMFRIYGVSPTPDGIVEYSVWRNSVLPEELAHQEALIKDAINRHEINQREFHIHRNDNNELRLIQAAETIRLNMYGQVEWLVGTNLDITDRYRMEQKIKETARLLMASQAVAHIGSWMITSDFTQMIWSEETFRIFGLPPESSTEPDLEEFYKLLFPDDKIAVSNWLEFIIHTGKPSSLEFRTRPIKGTIRWLSAIGEVEKDSSGQPCRLIGTLQDVSTQKRMTAELYRWADAFRYCGHGLAIGNPRTKCIETTNPAFAKMLGVMNPKQLEGTPILALFPPSEIDKVKAQIRQSNELGTSNFDSKHLHADGYEIDVNINLVSVRGENNEIIYRVASVQDITARKHAELAFKEAAARTQSILDTVADGIITIDKTGKIETFNPAAQYIFGYTQEEAIGNKLNMLMPEPYHSESESYLKNYLTSKEPKIIGIGRIVEGLRRDGTTFPLDLAISETRLGEKTIFTGIVRDITERQLANNNLRAALNEKDILLKEVYHRVKNNLQVVSSLINLQSRHVKNEEALELLRQSADRLKAMALIHEKLYQSNDLAKIDFADYVAGLIDSLLYSFGIKASQIKITSHIENVFLNLDEAIPCGLIINELVSNALKHAFPQFQPGQTIDLSFSHDNQQYKLIITDNGAGFPAEIDITKSKSLGLQLVNRLATSQLMGQVTVKSEDGTTFIVQFPDHI